MNTSKFATGLGIALMGAIGAFATAKTYAPNIYYYQSSVFSCTPTVVNFDCEPGVAGCIGPSGQPSAGKQLYLTQISPSVCRTGLQPV